LDVIAFLGAYQQLGLGPRRDESATVDLDSADLFAGLVYRRPSATAGMLTIRLDTIGHDATLTPRGRGFSVLSPDGWRGHWFAAVGGNARGVGVALSWGRLVRAAERSHVVTATVEGGVRRLDGTVAETPIVVLSEGGEIVRRVEFGPPASITASDR